MSKLRVISHYVRSLGMRIPKKYIVRINVAWMSSLKELEDIIKAIRNDVFVDFPTRRKKPPIPKVKFKEVVKVLNRFKNVKYFAYSNAEMKEEARKFRKDIPKRIKIVPKIETRSGIKNLKKITKEARTNLVMIDKEDLYVSVGMNPRIYNQLLRRFRRSCRAHQIKALWPSGILFGELR